MSRTVVSCYACVSYVVVLDFGGVVVGSVWSCFLAPGL